MLMAECGNCRRRAAAYKELAERTKRHQQLQRMAQRSTLSRHLMVS